MSYFYFTSTGSTASLPTADSNIIIKSVGAVDDQTLEDIIEAVVDIISI